mmetsp:Transcript_23780/g.60819  ORF Transcript_23780/g.60819 Transcript_23780/m.60819 type:complete len:212 (+) Transcript_23780:481-1116(+)
MKSPPMPLTVIPGTGNWSGSAFALMLPASSQALVPTRYKTAAYGPSQSHGSISTLTPTLPRPRGRICVHSPKRPAPLLVDEQAHGPPDPKQGRALTTSQIPTAEAESEVGGGEGDGGGGEGEVAICGTAIASTVTDKPFVASAEVRAVSLAMTPEVSVSRAVLALAAAMVIVAAMETEPETILSSTSSAVTPRLTSGDAKVALIESRACEP